VRYPAWAWRVARPDASEIGPALFYNLPGRSGLVHFSQDRAVKRLSLIFLGKLAVSSSLFVDQRASFRKGLA
jgi:hypothetical protein